MKEFKKVNQNDLLSELLKVVNKKLGVDITKVEVENYEEEDITNSGMYKSKSMFIKLDNVDYYVSVLYNSYDDETTLYIYKIIDGKKGIVQTIKK